MTVQARHIQVGDRIEDFGEVKAVQNVGIFRTFYGKGACIRFTVFCQVPIV